LLTPSPLLGYYVPPHYQYTPQQIPEAASTQKAYIAATYRKGKHISTAIHPTNL
jgi:hypothetical protein